MNNKNRQPIFRATIPSIAVANRHTSMHYTIQNIGKRKIYDTALRLSGLIPKKSERNNVACHVLQTIELRPRIFSGIDGSSVMVFRHAKRG